MVLVGGPPGVLLAMEGSRVLVAFRLCGAAVRRSRRPCCLARWSNRCDSPARFWKAMAISLRSLIRLTTARMAHFHRDRARNPGLTPERPQSGWYARPVILLGQPPM